MILGLIIACPEIIKVQVGVKLLAVIQVRIDCRAATGGEQAVGIVGVAVGQRAGGIARWRTLLRPSVW